jgi:hypothetical protein
MTAVVTFCVLAMTLQQSSAQAPADWKAVDQILGRSGALQGESYRVGFPRSDLHVTVGTVTVRPALALGSWVTFKQTGDSTAMLTGDLVLLESEVGPVIDALQREGVEPTAVHNHLIGESPRVIYVHIGGRGRLNSLATAVHDALARTKTPPVTPAPAAEAALATVDTGQIATILGAHGKVNGGVYQVGVPRATPVMMDSIEVPPAMGVATAINFQRTGSSTAAVTGDLVLIASEVAPVMRALRANGIAVTALHSHMLIESPRLLFMHFWGAGDELKLARGLRAALDAVDIKRN